MIKYAMILVACSVLVGAALTGAFRKSGRTNSEGGESKAVLELFTSEGCSSCPPADELAARLQNEFGAQLYVLEFHVDYWDRLGWKDPYSLSIATQRQRIYGERLKLESIYTPQAVINGTAEAVGSDANKLNTLIRTAISIKPAATILLNAKSSAGREVTCSYEYHGPAAKINIALLQSASEVLVKAGENGGKKLHHTNIVRDFQQQDVPATNGKSEIKLEVPAGLNATDISVIAYAQQPDGKIVAANVAKPSMK